MADGRSLLPTPPRRNPAAWARLSYAQERLWFLEQLEPENPAYQRPWALRLRGTAEPQALEWCLNEIIRRHEILRTNYTSADGLPVQTAHPAAWSPLPVLDLLGLAPEGARRTPASGSRRRTAAARPGHDEITQPELMRLAPDDHVLFFRTHHIAFDGWSEGVLLRELAELYPAWLSGHPATLAEPELQYADFAAWQRSPEAEAESVLTSATGRRCSPRCPPTLLLPTTPGTTAASGWEAGRRVGRPGS